MNTSINELAALAKKAARGAGYSWSMADEAAFATSWLCRNGVDGTTVVSNHLKLANELGTGSIQLQSLNWPLTGQSNGLCALSSGASISDLAGSFAESKQASQIELKQVISAALLLPYFALASQHLQSKQPSSTANACATYVRCKHFEATLLATTDENWLSQIDYHQALTQGRCTNVYADFNPHSEALLAADSRPRLHRTNMSLDALAVLNQFAEKTYAPATDASRQGAGAGQTDND